MRNTFIVIIFFIVLGVILGKFLDLEDERVVDQLYARTADGIIEGTQSIEVIRSPHEKNALVFIHGFMDSPEAFKENIADIKDKVNADIYAPLLPYQSRNLQTAAQFKNDVIIQFLTNYFATLAKKYQNITVVGHSYGGLLLIAMQKMGQLPNNIHIILYAPAVFITTNTVFGNFEVRAYGLWRNYCNYTFLGCGFPGYESGDAAARTLIAKEPTLRYVIMSAMVPLYTLDLENRDYFKKMDKPHSIIIAKDDNRVSYSPIAADCLANKKYCTLYPFATGRHLLHWGKNKKAWEELIVSAVNKF